MYHIIKFFVNRRLIVNVMMIMILILGVVSIKIIKKQTFPDAKFDMVIIDTIYPGASPKDVEQNVTRLLEDQIDGVAGIKKYLSFSLENVSTLVIEIDPDAEDSEEVVEDIKTAVDRVRDLPAEVEDKPFVLEIESANFPVLMIGVSGDVPYKELVKITDDLEKKIRRINGVSSAAKTGYRDKEIHIDIDADKLKENYIALNEVLFAIQNRNIRAGGGALESFRARREIMTISEFSNLEDIKNVIVRAHYTGSNIRVRDIADVKYDFEKETVRARFNGKSGIELIIVKKENADQIQVVDSLNELIKKEKEFLPEGVYIITSHDTSKFVRNRLKVISQNAILGFILVLIILFIFLNFRVAFWTSLSIPVAIAFTFIVMELVGIDITVISLATIIMILGMLVDDAIIVAENIYRHRILGKSAFDAALTGTREVMWPVTCTVITSIFAFAPMFFFKGMMGKFIWAIPACLAIGLAGSLLDSFTILPCHVSHAKFSDKITRREQWVTRLRDRYGNFLRVCLKFRYPILLFFIVFLVGMFFWAKKYMDFNLFPQDAAEVIGIKVKTDPISTHNATENAVKEFEKEILELPDNELSGLRVQIGNSSEWGAPEGAGFPNQALIVIYLTSANERDRSAQEIMDKLKAKIKVPPSVEKANYKVYAGGPPTGKPIELNIHSNVDDKRAMLTDQMFNFVKTIPGVGDVERDDDEFLDQIRLVIDYDRLSNLGLTVADVASTIRIAYDGVTVTEIVKNNEDFDIRVRFADRFREDYKDLLDLGIRNQLGKLIQILRFAKLKKVTELRRIHHFNGDVTTRITAELNQKITTSKKASELISEKLQPISDKDIDLNYTITGEAEETAKALGEILKSFLMAVFAIYLILLILFNSVTQPIMIMSTIPFALIGVILTLLAHGFPSNFMSMIGAVGLCGVVVNDSIVMVDFINNIKKKGVGVTNIKDAIISGAKIRLRPILLTTFTTVAGVLPTAYGFGGSDVYIQRLVLPIAWGLLFATLLTLILVPCIYHIDNDVKNFFSKLWNWSRSSSLGTK